VFWTTPKEYLIDLITVQNSVVTDAVDRYRQYATFRPNILRVRLQNAYSPSKWGFGRFFNNGEQSLRDPQKAPHCVETRDMTY